MGIAGLAHSRPHMRDTLHSKSPSLPPSRLIKGASYNRNFRPVHGPDGGQKLSRLVWGYNDAAGGEISKGEGGASQ